MLLPSYQNISQLTQAYNLTLNRSAVFCLWPFHLKDPHPPWIPHPISWGLFPPNQNTSRKEIEFSPWKPGDAYSPDDEPWPPYFTPYGVWRSGGQIREYDHKTRRWFYHSAPGADPQAGYTGAVLVAIMVLLLWLYSMYRLWLVWAFTLNFDGAVVQRQKGWDFLVQWILHRIITKRRKRKASKMSQRTYDRGVQSKAQSDMFESPKEDCAINIQGDRVYYSRFPAETQSRRGSTKPNLTYEEDDMYTSQFPPDPVVHYKGCRPKMLSFVKPAAPIIHGEIHPVPAAALLEGRPDNLRRHQHLVQANSLPLYSSRVLYCDSYSAPPLHYSPRFFSKEFQPEPGLVPYLHPRRASMKLIEPGVDIVTNPDSVGYHQTSERQIPNVAEKTCIMTEV